MNYREKVYERYISTHLAAEDRYPLQANPRLAERYYRLNYSSHLPPDRSVRILDIGCGMGQFLDFLKASGYPNSVGIDQSDEAVQRCQARGLAVEKCEALDYLARHMDEFGAVVLNDVVEHFPKSQALDLTQSCFRSLHDSGVILIKTVNGANPIVGAHSLAIDLTHEWLYCEESLSQLLRVCGFRDIRILPLNIYTNPWNPVHWCARLLSGCLNLVWRLLYVLYGRPGTRCFTKSILAVAKK